RTRASVLPSPGGNARGARRLCPKRWCWQPLWRPWQCCRARTELPRCSTHALAGCSRRLSRSWRSTDAGFLWVMIPILTPALVCQDRNPDSQSLVFFMPSFGENNDMVISRPDPSRKPVRPVPGARSESPMTDAELLNAFVGQRDQAAFAEMVRRHG